MSDIILHLQNTSKSYTLVNVNGEDLQIKTLLIPFIQIYILLKN